MTLPSMSRRRTLPLDLSNDRVHRRVLDVADAVGDFIAWWGFKANHGRLWTYLALRNQPLSQTELARALGVSRSLVSIALADLTAFHLVSPTSDHRNAPYEARMDVWSSIAQVLRSREWMMIESVRIALEAVLEEAEADDDDSGFDLERVQLLLRMTELAQSMLRVIIALGKPSAQAASGVVGILTKVRELTRRLRH